MSSHETALKALLSSTSPTDDTISTLVHLCTSVLAGQASKADKEELREMVHERYHGPLDNTTVYEWTQWNTFVAILTRHWPEAQNNNDASEGFEQYALLVIRNGLESLPEPSSHPLHISHHDKLKNSGPEGWVPAAIAWIKHHGDHLYENTYHRGGTDLGTAGRGGPRWKDEFQGFSYERWCLWRKIWNEIGEVDCVDIMDDIAEDDNECQLGYMITHGLC